MEQSQNAMGKDNYRKLTYSVNYTFWKLDCGGSTWKGWWWLERVTESKEVFFSCLMLKRLEKTIF
jgi:hypothetical protein